MIEAKEKAAGVLPAPEAAIQKQSQQSVRPSAEAVNRISGASMLDAMERAGLAPAKSLDLICDGRLRRYRVRGDKAGSRNGWAVLHGAPMLAGAFGSWKSGESHTWCEARFESATPAQRAQVAQQLKAMKTARDAEQADVYLEASERAQTILRSTGAACDSHPYLIRKNARAHGARHLRGALVVPVRNVYGELQSLQFIHENGTKMFLSGGRVSGGFFLIGQVDKVLLIAEGFATGSTLHQATGHAVAVAFNCGNLAAVAKALRGVHRGVRIVVCADNDLSTAGNPGLTKAQHAARLVGGYVAVPRFKGASHV